MQLVAPVSMMLEETMHVAKFAVLLNLWVAAFLSYLCAVSASECK